MLAWTVNEDGCVAPPPSRPRDRRAASRAAAPRRHGADLRARRRSRLSRDGRHAAVLWAAPQRPAELYVVETATGQGAPRHRQRGRRAARARPRRARARLVPDLGRPRDRRLALPAEEAAAASRSCSPSTAGPRRRSGPWYQPLLPVPRQPRDRRARDEHPRLDRLRQDVPDADPPRLGRRRPPGLRARGALPAGSRTGSTPTGSASTAARTAASPRSRASPGCRTTGRPRSTSSARATWSRSRRPCRRPGAGSWTSGSAIPRPRSTS